MADADTGEFWAQFGGFAPLPRKTTSEGTREDRKTAVKLLCFNQGKPEPISSQSLAHDLLETNKCYLLDCGAEMYVWLGRSTSFQLRKGASEAAEKILNADSRTQSHVMKVEGYETVMFKSKFNE